MYEIEITGRPGITGRVATTDTSTVLTTLLAPEAGGKLPIAALVTCEVANVRFAFGVAPVQGATGLGHLLAPGQSFRISNPAAVKLARFISELNATPGNIIVTYEYFI